MRIDSHVHVLPEDYLRELPPIPLPPSTLEGLEESMSRYAIDAAIISTGPPGAFVGDASAAPRIAKIANDAIAGIVHDRPEKFAGVATLPLPDIDAALSELSRALDDLELDGVMLLTNVAGQYLGDPALEPLFEALNDRGAYVFIHPGFPPYKPPLEDPIWLYEFPFETVRAVANLIYSGTLERHPNIRIQLSHLGGAAPFLAHRLASLADREPALARAAPAGALDYLSRFYYDTGLANNQPALVSTQLITGTDHIVFGTDWPWAALPAEGNDPAPGLAGLGADRQAVEGENVRQLVKRWAAA